ncbi:GPI mannosyltransferase 1 [Penicillium macrosclerotiorum]|uniref:GPI mannosyltransferase 1 n=1 Tax=Penicillium macrosclerotiorum TaxID=303699 RepID=UPI002547D778|nr:GPI mannosyltransferase 1 [Penicillium macrosclerotiorum]KAJ5698067.1 GPI mannosyltransferase 1 [Penicillium macrosclerotiorum]
MAMFDSASRVFLAATALRLILLVYGGWQDAHSAVKYTDIDYMVFTDASRFVAKGQSPYTRDTYRYTPLLSWILLPTAWEGMASLASVAFAFGKILFALADVLAGWLVVQLLCRCYQFPPERALRYVATVWLWNPMVANISTRGSSEGLLGVLVAALLWATLTRRAALAGVILGLSVHFKIYPFIYGVSILWWWDAQRDGASPAQKSDLVSRILGFVTPSRVILTFSAVATFFALNIAMYMQYGMPFLHQTFFHHLTRIDHRHNFSPYSTLMYLASAGDASYRFEALAFLPQLLLVVIAIPLVLAKKSLATTMLAQTFAFVTFNKVCTSQYFIWYLILLPFYLPSSSLIKKPTLGITAAILWVLGQALWLSQGYNLEFLGLSAFVPGLFLASLFFFAVNIWILGIIIHDVGEDENINPVTKVVQ